MFDDNNERDNFPASLDKNQFRVNTEKMCVYDVFDNKEIISPCEFR